MENVLKLPFLCQIKHCNHLSVNKHTKSIGINVWNLSDCCLTPIQQFVSYIMARTN